MASTSYRVRGYDVKNRRYVDLVVDTISIGEARQVGIKRGLQGVTVRPALPESADGSEQPARQSDDAEPRART